MIVQGAESKFRIELPSALKGFVLKYVENDRSRPHLFRYPKTAFHGIDHECRAISLSLHVVAHGQGTDENRRNTRNPQTPP